MPPAYVKAYVKRGKTDAADAKAICEAVTPPTMRFVPIKSPESQAVLSLHGARDLMVKQRAQAVNMLRGLLAEFGIDLARGIHHRLVLARRIAEGDAPAVPPLAVRVATGLAEQVHDLQARITDLDKELIACHRDSELAKRLSSTQASGSSRQAHLLRPSPIPVSSDRVDTSPRG